MVIKLSRVGGTSLEYNVIGGVLDFYFLAGSESDPRATVNTLKSPGFRQNSLTGHLAFISVVSVTKGAIDFVDVAGVITKYATANIPLEIMWTDIDYIARRRIFTTDPQYFPLDRMRDIVDYLHSHDQHCILMTDPAVAYTPMIISISSSPMDPRNQEYGAYHRGKDLNIYLKTKNGSDFLGLVWPGITVYPDWFNSRTVKYWNHEFLEFYNPKTGIDVDGAWINMNEPSNSTLHKRDDILNPTYVINNAAGVLSSKTVSMNVVHANGLQEYDTHNLYGTMMSVTTRLAMIARRPGKRPLIITRSTFAGAGAHVGKWLGDNVSLWEHYRSSIAGMLNFAAIFQVPTVGSDHNQDASISQEFYSWESVAQAARNAIDIRYRLLDYMYTAFHQAHTDGTPVLHPLWFKYPKDYNTFSVDLQFFYGDSILVSPVTKEDSTLVDIYPAKDIFYDFLTLTPMEGTGSMVTLNDINFTAIPLHIKGGSVLPLRVESAYTTTVLREKDFEIVVAPSQEDTASGEFSEVEMTFKSGLLDVHGAFNYETGVKVARVRFLNVQKAPTWVTVNDKQLGESLIAYDALNKVLDVTINIKFDRNFSVEYC
ncbi:hypothetical protein Ac2012v2_001269 [Leucoagaricus gongylophorus]